MKKVYRIAAVSFIFAFASIIYELVLAQALSAFLGNTILHYSITVGLYLFALGIGALAATRAKRRARRSLLRVEALLVVLGAASVLAPFFIHAAGAPLPLLAAILYATIAAIGVLSGFELPLLLEIARKEAGGAGRAILASNYFGALFGSLSFAFIFFPFVGMVGTAFAAALTNAAGGIIISWRKTASVFFFAACALLLSAGLVYEEATRDYLTELYLAPSAYVSR